MIEVQPSGYEEDLQLLPGSKLRDAALVDSIDELKAQMEADNNRISKSRNKITVVVTLIAVVGLFLVGGKYRTAIRWIGSALGLLALVNGANNAQTRMKVMPTSDQFSAKDRAYNFIDSMFSNKPSLVQSTTNVVIRSLIATKLIKPSELRVKQNLLKTNKGKVSSEVRNAVINYEG